MFENIGSFFKKIMKNDTKELVSDTTLSNASKEAAKERLQLVLMQDRANVSADFLELMKQEIIDVIKKYIVVDEESIDVRLTNQSNTDGTKCKCVTLFCCVSSSILAGKKCSSGLEAQSVLPVIPHQKSSHTDTSNVYGVF